MENKSTQGRRAILRLKNLAFLLGLSVLAWLPFEDSHEAPAMILAGLIALLGAASYLSQTRLTARPAWMHPLSGLAAGMAVAPLALLLMGIKNGLHAHAQPEYTPQQLLAVLYSLPVWSLAGLLVGSALAIWEKEA
jgi:hypothetical protein